MISKTSDDGKGKLELILECSNCDGKFVLDPDTCIVGSMITTQNYSKNWLEIECPICHTIHEFKINEG